MSFFLLRSFVTATERKVVHERVYFSLWCKVTVHVSEVIAGACGAGHMALHSREREVIVC